MRTNEDAATRYFRTAKGSHRHADWHCANFRRSIHLGDVVELTAAEVAEWAPCDVCCTGHEVTEHAEQARAAAAAQCRNSGVVRPKHIQSECRDCGKRGTVNRATGRLRAHKPAK
jgi:hypothetical protein